MLFGKFEQSGAKKEQEIPKNLESDILNKIDLDVIEEKIKNAKPATLEMIGKAFKSKGTWIGMLGVVMGAYMVDRAFNNTGEVSQNIIDQVTDHGGNPDPEKVKQLLSGLKFFAVSFLAGSGLLTYLGYEEGNDPSGDYVKYRNDGYLHKDTFTDKKPNFEDGFITDEEWLKKDKK